MRGSEDRPGAEVGAGRWALEVRRESGLYGGVLPGLAERRNRIGFVKFSQAFGGWSKSSRQTQKALP